MFDIHFVPGVSLGVMETVISKRNVCFPGVLVLETDIKRTFKYMLTRVVCEKGFEGEFRGREQQEGLLQTGGCGVGWLFVETAFRLGLEQTVWVSRARPRRGEEYLGQVF